ncbi:MAG: paraquat-inducible protein A [Hyphomicrobiaceae bacterium]
MTLGGRRFLLSLIVLGASVCLALGISKPIVKITQYVFWTTEHSLITAVRVLIHDGHMFLGLAVLVFSIVFPVVKLLYLLLIASLSEADIVRLRRRLSALAWLGKWSMHDVLVLALTVFFIKSQGIYDAASLTGVYFFTAAVALMILAYSCLGRSPARAGPTAAPVETMPAASVFRNFVLSFLIIVATVSFVLGIMLPVIRFTTVYVWTNEHSIVTILWALYHNREYFLCGVLFAVSIFFPFLKLFYLLTLMMSPDLSPRFREKSIATMEWLGRYSMTDVMVLALMIFYINSSGYTEASMLPGVYFFAASALITMLAYGWASTGSSRRSAATAKPAVPTHRAHRPKPHPRGSPPMSRLRDAAGKR